MMAFISGFAPRAFIYQHHINQVEHKVLSKGARPWSQITHRIKVQLTEVELIGDIYAGLPGKGTS
jgi:hypothetical protein